MNRACLIVLWVFAGCDPPAPEAAATAPLPAASDVQKSSAERRADAGSPVAHPGGSGAAVKEGATAPDGATPSDAAQGQDPKDAALLLGHGVRNRLATGDLGPWLAQRAEYPFDLDGKEVALDSDQLARMLPGHLEAWTRQTATQTRCEALSREEILAGAPLHYLDRLGRRPPGADLAKDLTRFGLDPGELFVNCYTPEGTDAGYTLIVTPQTHIQAFRN